MKNELKIYALLMIAIAMLILSDANLFHKSTGELLTKVVDVSAVQKLQIDLPCNVYLVRGVENKLVFEGPADVLNKVEAVVEGQTLKVTEKPGIDLLNLLKQKLDIQQPVNIYVNLPDLTMLDVAGQAHVISPEFVVSSTATACNQDAGQPGIKEILHKLACSLANISIS